jgi:hypothetical protein
VRVPDLVLAAGTGHADPHLSIVSDTIGRVKLVHVNAANPQPMAADGVAGTLPRAASAIGGYMCGHVKAQMSMPKRAAGTSVRGPMIGQPDRRDDYWVPLQCGAPAVDLVELVRRYSNRADLLERLTETRSRARLQGGEDPGSHTTTVSGRVSGVWRVRDRLTDDDVLVLIADFLAGTSKRKLADRYDVSFSTVKNILRKHGVRRTNKS